MATNDTAALVVALSAQLTKFEKDMDTAAGLADRGAKKIEDRFAKIDPSAGLGEFASKLEGLLTAGGVIAFITSLHELVAEVAKIGDQAERVGLTAEQFQQLRFAAVSTGASVDSAGSFMDRFSRSVSEAGRGAGELYKTFLINNVAIKDANGNLLPTTELLRKFADLVKNAKNAQDQMNLAVLAGGRQAGPEFVSVLKEGSDGLKRYADEADRSGTVASDALIKQAKLIETQYNQLWLKLKVGAQGFAVDVANSVKDTSAKLEADANATGGTIKSTWQSIVDYIKDHTPDALSFLSDDQKRLLELGKGVKASLLGTRSDNAISSSLPPGTDPRRSAAPEESGDKSTKLFDEQAEAFKKLLALEDQRIKLLGAEQAAIGLTAGAAEELKTKVNLETAAKRENIPLTEQRKAAIDAEAAKVGQAAQAVDDYKRRWANFNTGLQFVGTNALDVLDGLRTKTLSASQAALQLTNSLIRAVEQAALLGSGPFANMFGSQSTVPNGTGGLFGAIGGAFSPVGSSGGAGTLSSIASLGIGGGPILSPFDDGGFTGAGGKNDPAGIVHRGEFVFDADSTSRIGVSNLRALQRGYADGGLVGGPSFIPNNITPRGGPSSGPQIVYSPTIDARGADAAAVARLASAMADDRRNFERNVMATVRGNLRLDAGALNR